MSLEIVIAGVGMALILEGLAFVLAPSRLDDLLAYLAQIPQPTRRLIGFAAMVGGVVLIAWAASL